MDNHLSQNIITSISYKNVFTSVFLILCWPLFLNAKHCLPCGGGVGGRPINPCGATNSTIYVDSSNNNTIQNGKNWETAYKYLQDALENANKCENVNSIHVAQGRYKVSTSTPMTARDFNFFVGNSYSILGGYPSGGGPDRNPKLYQTILDGNTAANYEAYHVMVIYNASVTIDGFRFINGFADGSGNFEDDDILINRTHGPGIYAINSTVKIKNCVIINNTGIGDGGGIFATDTSNIIISNSIIANNLTGDEGGGMCLRNLSTATITNTTFFNNRAAVTDNGGAIYNTTGTTLNTYNSIYWGNHAGNESNNFNGGGDRNRFYCIIENGNYNNHNIPEDPGFINVFDFKGPDNLWLTEDDGLNVCLGSVAINNGLNNAPSILNVDIQQLSRIEYQRVDIGPYERHEIKPEVWQVASYGALDSGIVSNYSKIFSDQDCRIIAIVAPNGSDTLPRDVKAYVYNDSLVQYVNHKPYVGRSYYFEKYGNGTGSNYRITLYFYNSDFENYNLQTPECNLLPTNGLFHVARKVNIRVIQSTGSFGINAPDGDSITYINPSDSDIDFSNDVWRITFNTTKLGGFYLTAQSTDPPKYYKDQDNDGYGDGFVFGCVNPPGRKTLAQLDPLSNGSDDCVDTNPNLHPNGNLSQSKQDGLWFSPATWWCNIVPITPGPASNIQIENEVTYVGNSFFNGNFNVKETGHLIFQTGSELTLHHANSFIYNSGKITIEEDASLWIVSKLQCTPGGIIELYGNLFLENIEP